MSPLFGLTQYCKKTNIWTFRTQSWFVNQKNRKKKSIKHKYPSVLHVSQNVEDDSPIHCINFKPTKRNPHKSIKHLQVQPIAQVAFDCILFVKSSLTEEKNLKNFVKYVQWPSPKRAKMWQMKSCWELHIPGEVSACGDSHCGRICGLLGAGLATIPSHIGETIRVMCLERCSKCWKGVNVYAWY